MRFPLSSKLIRSPLVATAALLFALLGVGTPVNAAQLSDSDVVKLARPWLVHISQGKSSGSGIVVSPKGLIATNAHVLASTGPVQVRSVNGQTTEAQVLRADKGLDLAILRVSVSGLEPAKFGDPARLALGDRLIVMGFALNLPGEPSVTSGVFSGLRKLRGVDLVQTDAAMNPGVSGGSTLDLDGEVVAMNELSVQSVGGQPVQGVNFGIASTSIANFVNGSAIDPSERITLTSGAMAPTALPATPVPTTAPVTPAASVNSQGAQPARNADRSSNTGGIVLLAVSLLLLAIAASTIFFVLNRRTRATGRHARSREQLGVGPGGIGLIQPPRLVMDGRQFALRPGHELLVGRDPQCGIVLDDSGVSRRHARILPVGVQFDIEDLGSTNGVFVNNQRVTKARLMSGDRIRLGSSAELIAELS